MPWISISWGLAKKLFSYLPNEEVSIWEEASKFYPSRSLSLSLHHDQFDVSCIDSNRISFHSKDFFYISYLFCYRDKWPKDYWRRDFQQKYLPFITRSDTKLSDYLQQNGFVLKVISHTVLCTVYFRWWILKSLERNKSFQKQFTLENQNFNLENKLQTLHGLIRTLNPTTFVDSIILAHIILFVAYTKFKKVTVAQ